MKTIKNLLFTLMLGILSQGLLAQEKVEYRFEAKGKLIIDGINKISFEGYDGNEVIISTEIKNSSSSDRAEGLKLINGTGLEDNTGIGLSVNNVDGNTEVVEISSRSSKRYKVMLPQTVTVVYKHTTPFGSKVNFSKISGEIEANTVHSGIVLADVTGPMTISTVHGKIEGNFKTVNQSGAISLASSHGLIDISVPASTKADLQISTSWGEIYSDLDIAIKKSSEEMKNYSANNVEGTLNGGGVNMSITATHGNVYLRKK